MFVTRRRNVDPAGRGTRHRAGNLRRNAELARRQGVVRGVRNRRRAGFVRRFSGAVRRLPGNVWSRVTSYL